MNCQEFEPIVIELARNQLLDSSARDRGLEHVQRCAPCAMLLVEEQALSENLRAFSAQAAAEEIPARLEIALLTAFRQRVAAPTLATTMPPAKRRRPLAAAALALLAFALSLAGWIMPSPERKSSATSSIHDVSIPTPIGISATPEKSGKALQQIDTVRQIAWPIPDSTKQKHQKRMAPTSAMRQSTSVGAPHEFVTQFFPVMQGSELIPMEGGQIVRVRMPRSNLIPLGIPLNQERASETIQADVLVSNDGLARAIRLVY